MQAFFDFVKSLVAARLAAIAAVTFALIGFFAFLMTAPTMVPLFTDLTLEDSAPFVKDLDRPAIGYQLKNEGAIMLVPKERVAKLRMQLAEIGLPKDGGVAYEIFDKSEALGAMSFIQNIHKLCALEGELARTIRSLDKVDGARASRVGEAMRGAA